MKTLIAIMALICGICAAHAFGLGEGNRFGKLGSISRGGGGSAPPVLTNLRITNTGAFRITNTSANRAVFP